MRLNLQSMTTLDSKNVAAISVAKLDDRVGSIPSRRTLSQGATGVHEFRHRRMEI